jgi:arylsulfatase A-like enzyme
MEGSTGRSAARSRAPTVLLALLLLAAAPPVGAQVISVNFYHSTGTVAAGEEAGIVQIDGWNNLQAPGGFGLHDPAAGWGPVTVNDDSGLAAASVTSTLGSYYNGDSGTGATGLGASMMSEYVSWDSPTDGVPPDDSGTITVSGLGAEYTGPGYDVYLYFDTDVDTRTHTITISGQTVIGDDASTFNGVLVEAVGAGSDANYAVFRGLTAPSFSIDMDSSSGRGAMNGLQVVSASYVPPPLSGPHILLFVVDDMGWQDTSEPFADAPTVWNGLYRTPSIESLARSGIKLTDAYAASPVCSPSRTSLLTGRNPARTHITNWLSLVGRSNGNSIITDPLWASQGLQPGDGNTTLSTVLRDHGYLTAHVGKAHVGARETVGADPTTLGFDINVGGSGWGDVNGTGVGYFPDYGGTERVPGVEAYWPAGTYLNDALNAEAAKIIDQAIAANRPLFLNMWHYAVHTPIPNMGDPMFVGNYPTRPEPEDDYAAMLESIDHSLGVLVAHLQARGIADDTLVVFTSDNGGLSRFVRYDSPDPEEPWHRNEHNRPVASGKGASFEGGLRVPMVVAWAGQDPALPPVQPGLPIAPGSVSAEPVHTDDLFETLIRIADVPNAEPYFQDTDGVDIGPLLAGQPFDRGDALYFHYPHQWVDDVGVTPGIEPFTALREGRWKLIYYWSNRNWELYDLQADLEERTDLSVLQSGVVHELGTRMIDWLVAVGAQVPRDAITLIDEPLPRLPPPGCDDGVDNDGDGLTDAAEDVGCTGPGDTSEWDVRLSCDDGSDNDGDGLTDLADPVCASPTFGRERAKCQDGLDNDGGGGTDWDGGESILGAGNGDPNGPDPQCSAPWDDSERLELGSPWPAPAARPGRDRGKKLTPR